MKNIIKQIVGISILLLPSSSFAWQWADLWQTANQQGAKLLHVGKAEEAAQVFKNKDWRAIALYKSGNYSQAFQQFRAQKTSDNQYNAGNAAAYLSQYQEAINAYDKAIALNPNNTDAITNREIIKKLMDKQKPQQNNSSADNKKDNNNNKKDKANNNSSPSQQNMGKNNSPPKNAAAKQNAQNNPQQSQRNEANQKTQENNSQQPQSGDQKFNSKQENETAAAASRLQATNEDKKQLLRRLAEDPGGLLRQKFLRDYFRRHPTGENPDQGEN